MLKCWETYSYKIRGSNDIPDSIPGLVVGPPFLIEKVQKAVKATQSRKAPGADRITTKALKAGGENMAEMAEMPLKICNTAWHQEK